MRHDNSVFHQLQQHIPWAVFERLVDEYKADHRTRHLNTKSQFLALLFGQLTGASSLREIEAGLTSQKARLYHVGARTIARTTLADANQKRPAALFGALFSHMASAASRQTRRHMRGGIRLIDATRIKLSSLSGGWADMVGGKHAIKVHVTHDPITDIPMDAEITGQRTSDIIPARTITIMPGVTYVFDLAYYDFRWWAHIDEADARFVTRLKNNTVIDVKTVNPVPTAPDRAEAIISDMIGYLPERIASSRRNPFYKPVRVITLRLKTGSVLRIVSNDIDATAEEIAALYKQRWQIELFFKWIKQNLKIRHFLGRSENAVRIQIFVALIAYILLRLAQACQTAISQPLTFTRLVRLNIMERRPLKALKTYQKLPPQDQTQLTLPYIQI